MLIRNFHDNGTYALKITLSICPSMISLLNLDFIIFSVTFFSLFFLILTNGRHRPDYNN